MSDVTDTSKTWTMTAGAFVIFVSLCLCILFAVLAAMTAREIGQEIHYWRFLIEAGAALLAAASAAGLVVGIGRSIVAPTAPGSVPPSVFRRRPWMPWALIALALLMFVAVALALLGVVHQANIPNELSLPVLAIAGVVTLLGALALVAVSFNLVGMSDKTQPLGLPQGSVRAVIALSLVVLFAILTVYLFSSLNSPYDQVAGCLTEAQSTQLLKERPSTEPQMIRRLMPRPGICSESPVSAPKDTPLYEVLAPRVVNQAGTDFAKQLLVLIGTLVTSVASFYFGSQAVSQAQSVVAGMNVAPSIQGVTPVNLELGRGKQSLDVLGTGLNGARQVQLSRGDEQISAIEVTSNEARVHAIINVPATLQPGGQWDVLVTDSYGCFCRLPSAVSVGHAVDKMIPEPATNTIKPPDSKPQQGVSPGPDRPDPGRASLLSLKTSVEAAAGGLANAGEGPSPASAAVDQWLATVRPLLDGMADPGKIAAAVTAGAGVLEVVQNAGPPGALADVLAVVRRVAGIAGPVIAGIPAGPVGIVAGVVLGGLQFAQEQAKFNALKATLLGAQHDPGIPPATPTMDMAALAVKDTPFSGASDSQALTIMTEALRLAGGVLVPPETVALALLAKDETAGLARQFATPALLAQAVGILRSGALFLAARGGLGGSVTVPAIGTEAPATLSLGEVLDWFQARRGDPDVAAAMQSLAGINEVLAKSPGDKQEAAVQALGAALKLATTRRQS